MIYAIANQKGGVGKSTTTHALATGLSRMGYKALVVELDPQGSISYIMGAAPGLCVYDLLEKRADAAAAIQHTEQGDIIPAGDNLGAAEITLSAVTGKEYLLREALAKVSRKYDFVLIDTPPALGTLTVNALTAADRLIIASQAEILSIQGIGKLYATVQAVKTYCNPALQIDGILLTKHNGRSNISRELAEMTAQTAESIGTAAYHVIIREGVAIKEAQAHRRSIYDYAPTSNQAADYAAFVNEFLQRSGKK